MGIEMREYITVGIAILTVILIGLFVVFLFIPDETSFLDIQLHDTYYVINRWSLLYMIVPVFLLHE